MAMAQKANPRAFLARMLGARPAKGQAEQPGITRAAALENFQEWPGGNAGPRSGLGKKWEGLLYSHSELGLQQLQRA